MGEIYLCRFPLASGVLSKPRPALVLFDLGDDALICRVTPVLRQGPLEVELREWKESGLAKPSVASLTRLVTAERSVFNRKLGDLSPRDREAVRTAWNQYMRL